MVNYLYIRGEWYATSERDVWSMWLMMYDDIKKELNRPVGGGLLAYLGGKEGKLTPNSPQRIKDRVN